MRSYFALIGLGLIVTAVAGVGLAWDGGYALFNILDTQSPNVAYGRYTQLPLHWIVIQASHLSANLPFLRITFGIVYASLTFLALVASWWIVRDREYSSPLFLWAALGIGLGTLPGQVCAVCQSIVSVQLFYPILLAILIGIPRRTIPVVALLAAAIFFAHPVSIALFALAALASILIGVRSSGRRRGLWLCGLAMAALAAAALFRFVIFRSPYEAAQLSQQVMEVRFNESLAGLPIAALVLAWLSGMVLLVRLIQRRTAHRGLFNVFSTDAVYYLSFSCLFLSGLILVIWALDPHQWAQAVGFREWALFVSLPFIVFAVIEGTMGGLNPSQVGSGVPGETAGNLDARGRISRTRLIQLSGLVFFVVVSIQSIGWLNLTGRLRNEMKNASTSCISASSLGWIQGTPLQHWSLTAYSLVIQNSSPEKVVMAGSGCADESFLSGLLVGQFGPGEWDLREWGRGWFDLSKLSDRLFAREWMPPSCTFPLTRGWYGIERSGDDWHRWTKGRAGIRVLLGGDSEGVLRGEIVSIQQPNEVEILLDGKPVGAVEIKQAGWQRFGPVHLSLSRGVNWIELVSGNSSTQIPGDTRSLAIALMDPTLTLAEGVTICR